MAASDWLFYDNAIEEFSSKFLDPDVAVSLFRHCLEKGFIRARCETVTRSGKSVPERGSLQPYIDDEGMIAPAVWDDLLFDAPANNPEDGSFSILNSWDARPAARMHGVRYHRSDIGQLVSRKGAGGAPFKKEHWLRLTSVLLDLALTGEIERFHDFASFLTFLDEEVNGGGDGLDRSSIRHPAKRLWDQITRQRLNQAG